MFFDRLFKLQSLKFHLLGSTSFVQNAQQFSPGKFRKEGAMLSPLIAGLLAACGSGSSDYTVLVLRDGPGSTEGGDRELPPQPDFTVSVADGPIWGARIYTDDGEHVGTTDENGQAQILIEHEGDDTIIGDPGNDLIDGGSGADTMTGGAGRDIFVLTLGDSGGFDLSLFDDPNLFDDSYEFDGETSDLYPSGDERAEDVVTDFDAASDKIRIATLNGDEATIAELKAAAQIDWSVDGEDTQIVYTGGETDELVMTLEGFTDELTIAHFDIV